MMELRVRRIARAGLVLAGGALFVSGCATVSPDEMEVELDQLREEMREEMRQGDEAVESRVDSRMSEIEDRLVSLEGDLDQLREDFDVTVERLETALRFNAPVHFAFDEAEVQPEDREVLERFAEVVSQHYEGTTITIEGFADPAGSQAYNEQLGLERAEAVRDFLAGTGLNADQLRAVSYGESSDRQILPGAQGPGEEGWQNRRVSMVIDFAPEQREGTPVMAGGAAR